MRRAGDGERLQPVVAADAVFLVHHQVALGNLGGLGDELVGALAGARRAANAFAQQVLLAYHDDALGGEAALDAERYQRNRAGRLAPNRGPALFLGGVLETVLAQQVGQPLARATGPGGDHQALALAGPALGLCPQLVERVAARRRGRGTRLREHRPRPAAAVDADRSFWLGERAHREQRAARQHRVPLRLIEVEAFGRQRPVRHLALARRRLTGRIVVGDHLDAPAQRLLGLMVEADRCAGQIVEQGLHLGVEQRHPVLHAGMAPPLGDRQVDRVLGRLLSK